MRRFVIAFSKYWGITAPLSPPNFLEGTFTLFCDLFVDKRQENRDREKLTYTEV